MISVVLERPVTGLWPFQTNTSIIVILNISMGVISILKSKRSMVNPFLESELNFIDNQTYISDAVTKISVFKDKGCLKQALRLPESGLKLLLYCFGVLEKGKDKVILDKNAFLKMAHYKSRQSFYDAKNALITEGFIAPYMGDVYWINPYYFFRGHRFPYAHKNKMFKLIKR